MKSCENVSTVETHTGIENEGGTLQVESEGNSVGTDNDAFSDTFVVVNLVPVILQLGGGGEELTEVNTGI